jgi:DNA replication protein DnaC
MLRLSTLCGGRTRINNDATLTSALLDRLLHHAETIVIEGQSYRMKDRIES